MASPSSSSSSSSDSKSSSTSPPPAAENPFAPSSSGMFDRPIQVRTSDDKIMEVRYAATFFSRKLQVAMGNPDYLFEAPPPIQLNVTKDILKLVIQWIEHHAASAAQGISEVTAWDREWIDNKNLNVQLAIRQAATELQIPELVALTNNLEQLLRSYAN